MYIIYLSIIIYMFFCFFFPLLIQIEELADPAVKNFVVEFSWRPETMASFFESPNSSTSSAIVKVEYEVRFCSNFDGFLSRDRPAALLLKSCSGVWGGQAILAVFVVVARKSSKIIINALLPRLHIHVLFYYEVFSYLLFYLELRSI